MTDVGICPFAVQSIIFAESNASGRKACRLPKWVPPAHPISCCHSSNLGTPEGPKWIFANLSKWSELMSRSAIPPQLERTHLHACDLFCPARKLPLKR